MIVQNVGHEGTTDLSFTVNEVDLGARRATPRPARPRSRASQDIATDAEVAKVSIVGAGIQNAPGYAARMFGALADAGINIEMISTSEIRITCIIAEDRSRRRGGGDPPHVPPRGSTSQSTEAARGSRLGSCPDAVRSRGSSASSASTRPRPSCAAGWPTGCPRSPSRSLTSRPPVAAGSSRSGRRRPARRSSVSAGFRPAGPCAWSTPGAWGRSSPWRCSTRPRTCRRGRAGPPRA